MNIFFKSEHCKTMAHCDTCRDKENKKWRIGLMKVFDDIKKVDFKCPYNKKWGTKKEIVHIQKERIVLKADGTILKNGKPCKNCSKK